MTGGSAAMTSGLAPVHGTSIYYESAGKGPTVVLIHAGVADSRKLAVGFLEELD